MLRLCRNCLRSTWSHLLSVQTGANALRHLETLLLFESRHRKTVHQRAFSTYSPRNPSRVISCTLDSSIPDLYNELEQEHEDRDEDYYYPDDAYYPMQMSDFNRTGILKPDVLNFNRASGKLKQGDGRFPLHADGVTSADTSASKSGDTILRERGGHSSSPSREVRPAPHAIDMDAVAAPVINQEQLTKRNQELASLIECRLRERLNPQCSVGVFGSAINGLWTDASDLDLCVQIPNVTSRSATIRNLRRISFLLEPMVPDRVFENRFTAKIPILHWKKAKKKKGRGDPIIDSMDCSIDISVNNVLALSNSALIGTYVACDPRVKSMILALKLWAQNKDLNDRSKGTFGSFALSLMVIHFLQRCTPPILVSLQDLAIANNEPPVYVSGVDVRFTTDMHHINKELNWASKGTKNNLTTLQLIQDFFYYYGWVYAKNPQLPIAIRSIDSQFMNNHGDLITNASAFDMEERFMHVDNPFEVGVDVANISFHQRNRIIKEIRKAYKVLKAGGRISDIMQ